MCNLGLLRIERHDLMYGQSTYQKVLELMMPIPYGEEQTLNVLFLFL